MLMNMYWISLVEWMDYMINHLLMEPHIHLQVMNMSYEYLSVPQHSQQQQTVNLLAKGRSRVQQQQTSISLLAKS